MSTSRLKSLLLGEFSGRRIVRSVIFIYILLCLCAYLFADRLLFQPQPSSYQDSNQIIKLATTDKVQISAAYLPNPSARYTILFSHGNAEDLMSVLPFRQKLQDIGFAVFAYDYRGYGTSEGVPSERNVYRDIDAAYNYLVQNLSVSPQSIIAYGRSIGSGSTVDLAVRRPVGGIVLESPFTTISQVVTRIPILPFDRFRNIDKITDVDCPVLVMHGKNDRIIPFSHGQRLYAAANEPKRYLWVNGADHNDFIDVAGEQYTKALREFAELVQYQNSSN